MSPSSVSPAPRDTGGAGRRATIRVALACLVLCLLNLGFQLFLHAGTLDNTIVSARHPASADALEYARVAATLAGSSRASADDAGPAPSDSSSPLPSFSQRFEAAFGDGWRMPGYPLFLAAFQGFDEPWRAARLAQIALTVPLGAVFFLTLLLLTAPRRGNGPQASAPGLSDVRPALAGGVLAALWPPLYHYSPALLAEAPSLCLTALLLLVLAASRRIAATGPARGVTNGGLAGLAGALVAALTYLKPNHLLLLGPVMLFLILQNVASTAAGAADTQDAARSGGARGAARRARLVGPLAAAAVTTALLAPWSLYVSQRQGTFVPLTLNAGYNLLLGTGRIPNGDPAALPYRAARALGIQEKQAIIGTKERSAVAGATERPPAGAVDGMADTTTTALVADQTARHAAARAAAWAAGGREAWTERPVALSLHGAAKALHAFGFSLRGARDVLLALFSLAAAGAGWHLWRRRRYRAWVMFAAACALAVALQAFVYLPNQRFKTVLFDPAALLLIALALSLTTPVGRKQHLQREA